MNGRVPCRSQIANPKLKLARTAAAVTADGMHFLAQSRQAVFATSTVILLDLPLAGSLPPGWSGPQQEKKVTKID